MHTTYDQHIAQDKRQQWLQLSRTAWQWTWRVKETHTPVCQKPQTKWARWGGSSSGPIWGRDKPLWRPYIPGHLPKHIVSTQTENQWNFNIVWLLFSSHRSAAYPRPRQPMRMPSMKHTSSTGTSQYWEHTRFHCQDRRQEVRKWQVKYDNTTW